MSIQSLPPFFFQMLRSFTTLARTLNLSQTAVELGATRQTISRHIKALEHLKGEKLIVLQDRRYELTTAGICALGEAEALLSIASSFVAEGIKNTTGLPSSNVELELGHRFIAQSHPVAMVWSKAPPLLKKGLKAWMTAQFELEHQAFKKIRPYMVIYRKRGDDWLCVDVGEKSSYATWLGSAWAKSAIGSSFSEDPVCSQADQFMLEAYNTAARTGSAWYDHVSSRFPRREGGELCPVNYQRLVFACLFPNGQPAVASLIARTNKISIVGLDSEDLALTPDKDLMEFEI